MATSLVSGRLLVQSKSTIKDALDLRDVSDPLDETYTQTWTDGTDANDIDQHFAATVTLTSGSTKVYDLNTVATAAGAVHTTSAFGANQSWALIKELTIKLATTTPGYELEIGGGDTPVPLFKNASDIYPLQAGGIWATTAPVDGIAVTAATADLLLLNNTSEGSVTFDIIIKGVKA